MFCWNPSKFKIWMTQWIETTVHTAVDNCIPVYDAIFIGLKYFWGMKYLKYRKYITFVFEIQNTLSSKQNTKYIQCISNTSILNTIQHWSWKVLEFSRLWCVRRTQPPDLHSAVSFQTVSLLFLSESDQRILGYGYSYHMMYIYIWLVNCCLSIFKHRWRTTGSWKNASGVLEIFVTKRVGTLSLC